MEKFCVVRDYGGSVGGVTCADFYEEQDAKKYVEWQKYRTLSDAPFEWKLYKEITEWDDRDEMWRTRYELLEGGNGV